MIPNDTYLTDLIVRFTKNSNAIEGNSLSLSDTLALYVDGGDEHRRYTGEECDMTDSFEAMKYMVGQLIFCQDVSQTFLKHLNLLAGMHTIMGAGEYKTVENVIQFAGKRGQHQETTPVNEVCDEVRALITDINRILRDEAITTSTYFKFLASFHIRFECIHPFADGNGRTGRLLLAFLAMKKGYDLPVITDGERALYFKYLRQRDRERMAVWLRGLSEQERRIRLELSPE
jgi:Fic family protein